MFLHCRSVHEPSDHEGINPEVRNRISELQRLMKSCDFTNFEGLTDT